MLSDYYICHIVRLVLEPFFFFFFNDTATTEIYTLSLHDALPIYCQDFTPISLDVNECLASKSLCQYNFSADLSFIREDKMFRPDAERNGRTLQQPIHLDVRPEHLIFEIGRAHV